MSDTIKVVNAEDVTTEVFLVEHQNGFVVDVESAESAVQFYSGRQPVAITGYTCITYNDDEGNECYLIVPDDTEIRVRPL